MQNTCPVAGLNAATPVCSDAGPGEIDLSWTSTGAGSYKVYRKAGLPTAPPTGYALVATISGASYPVNSNVTYRDGHSNSAVSTLTENGPYSYYLVSVVGGVDSAPSSAIQGITSNCTDLNASCTPNDSTPNVGQNVTFSTAPTGETGNYTYLWDSVTNLGPSITSSFQKSFSSAGFQSFIVVVNSVLPSDGTPYTKELRPACSVNVNVSCFTPTVDLRVDGSNGPLNLACGTDTNKIISWTTTNMPAGSTCTVSGKDTWTGAKTGETGSYTQPSGPFTGNTTLNISCDSGCGSANDSVTVNLSGSSSDFALSVSPTTIQVKQLKGATGTPSSESTTVTVAIAGCSTFNQPVDLTLGTASVTGMINGVMTNVPIQGVFNSAGNDNRLPQGEYLTGATLRIRPVNANQLLPVGTHSITITGTEVGGTNLVRTANISLQVVETDPGFKEI